jgi:Pentapeptide repeats (9 copies)
MTTYTWAMSNTPSHSQKKVVSVEILHLDALGYGPEGKHTRRKWREECLANLLAGEVAFKAWQVVLQSKVQRDTPSVDAGFSRTFDDWTTDTVLGITQASYALDFVGHCFESGLNAHKVEFLSLANFVGALFNSSAVFTNAVFNHGANFSDATFSEYVSFKKAEFSWVANFGNAEFNKHANFDDAIFHGNGLFNNTVFHDEAMFFSTQFDDYTLFSGASFDGAAYFRGAKFNEYVSFINATFSKSTYFTRAEFHNQCHFGFVQALEQKETSFAGEANFENSIFKNVGHFERVRFINLVPSFQGVDNATTRIEFSGDSYFPKHDRTEDAVNRLGHLKRLADEHGQTDQALNFNALELHAKAGLATTSSFTKLVTWVYGAVSDYGRSFTRPVATYVALLLITLLLATGHAAFCLPAKDCYGARWQILTDLLRTTAPCAPVTDDKLHISGYRAAAEYTLYRAAGVLDFSDNDKSTDAVARRLFGQLIEPWWMRVWGVFKAIASTALLFLTALGLRNKYRIK